MGSTAPLLELLAASLRPEPNVRCLAPGQYAPATDRDRKRKVGRRFQRNGLLFHPAWPGCDFEDKSAWPHKWEPRRMGGLRDEYTAMVSAARTHVACPQPFLKFPSACAQVPSSRPGCPDTLVKVIYPTSSSKATRSARKAAVAITETNRAVRKNGEEGLMVRRKQLNPRPHRELFCALSALCSTEAGCT